jgi:transcriptional regulator with XRE-family HTH domain
MRNRDKQIFQKAVGRSIRKRRMLSGYTIEELAEKVGVDPKHLNEIELGKRDTGSYILGQLQLELNLGTEYLQEYKQMKSQLEQED